MGQTTNFHASRYKNLTFTKASAALAQRLYGHWRGSSRSAQPLPLAEGLEFLPSHRIERFAVLLPLLRFGLFQNDWLARHPNVHFHFTPTSASWLNQVEIWFGIFTRKSLSGASFQSTEQLTQAIEAFVKRYNETAAPFVWRKREVKGAQLINTIVKEALNNPRKSES